MIFLFILIYLAFPVFTTPVLIYFLLTNKKHYKIYLLMVASNLGIIGYYFIPPNIFDLYRHFEKLDKIKYMNINEIWNYGGENPLIIENLIFYLISLTNDYGLLSYLAITVTYFFVFLIVYEYGVSKNLNKTYILFSMLFILTWFPILVPMSGVRFASALSMSIYGLFTIYYKKDWKGYIYIILAAFIHLGISLIIGVYLLLKLFKPKTIILILISLLISLEGFILVLKLFPIDYLAIVAGRIAFYKGFMLPGLLSSISYYCQFLFCILAGIYMIIRKKSIVKNHPNNMYNYIYVFLAIFIIFMAFPTIVIRYSYIVLVFIPIFIYDDLIKFEKNLRLIIYFIFIIIMLLGVLLQYFNMKGLIYKVNLGEGLTTSFYKIIFSLLNG